MIILTGGLSVGLSQFLTTKTPTSGILIPKTIPKTTSIIISKATIIIIFLERIITVLLLEASPILQPKVKQKMTIASGTLASGTIFLSTKIIIPKLTTIIIPTATTITLVLFLMTTMITLRVVTSLVPPLPLPPIATLTMHSPPPPRKK